MPRSQSHVPSLQPSLRHRLVRSRRASWGSWVWIQRPVKQSETSSWRWVVRVRALVDGMVRELDFIDIFKTGWVVER